MNKTQAIAVAGSLGFPSKMPGTAYGISAKACITGGKLAKVAGSVCHGCYALKANYLYPSVAHLEKICEVARQTPRIKHWLPTRELAIVKAFQKGGGIVPKNLVIRVSATMVDGDATQAWPTTSGVHNEKRAKGRACPAPQQEGKCGDCRACWNPRVKHVSYHLH